MMNRLSISVVALALAASCAAACSKKKVETVSPSPSSIATPAPITVDAGPADEPATAAEEDDTILTPGQYKNSRFGFMVDFLPELVPGREADNGDGRSFTSRDGSVEERVWGGWLESWGPTLNKLCTSLEGPPKSKVTYRSKGKDWCVTSGRVDNKIFYRKIIVSRGAFVSFELTYPESARATYDAKVGPLANSVTLYGPPTPVP
ncbi:hypothetical protein LZC95_00355 [Pendulispora brunnea]|uniref:Uncharacterized protein n=1 Tax=Pendulispora brunnea TaxID=2905690 RepID=A0ABZ2K9G9_9BACT